MGQPAARMGDNTAHGGVIVKGEPTVLIGGMPAARSTDMHTCPMLNPGVPPPPHVGGPIMVGSATVLIGKLPAARMGDMCTCAGPPDSIIKGCPTVLIGGPAVVPPEPPKKGGFWAGVWDALTDPETWKTAAIVLLASLLIGVAVYGLGVIALAALAAAGLSAEAIAIIAGIAKVVLILAGAALLIYGIYENASTIKQVYETQGLRAAAKIGTQLVIYTVMAVIGGVLAGRVASAISSKFKKVGIWLGSKFRKPYPGYNKNAIQYSTRGTNYGGAKKARETIKNHPKHTDPDSVWDQQKLNDRPKLKKALDDYESGYRDGKPYGQQARKIKVKGKSPEEIHNECLDNGFKHKRKYLKDENGVKHPHDIYEHEDGSLIRVKPEGVPGSDTRPQPHVNKGVKFDPSKGSQQKNEAFKVSDDEVAVPKTPKATDGMKQSAPGTPADGGSKDLENLGWSDEIMSTGHQDLPME